MFLHILLLGTLFGSWACAQQPLDDVLQPSTSTQDPPSCARASCVPPLRLNDAVRVKYILPNTTRGLERGVVEAGSWMAFALVRIGNQTIHETLLDGAPNIHPGQTLGPSLVARLSAEWMGRDKTPWTADDRPFHSLSDLMRRAKLDALDLGRMIQLARSLEHIFPKNPDVWIALAGHAFSPLEERTIVHALNTCDPATLQRATKLRKTTVQTLAAQRPVRTLHALHDLPWVNRNSLVKLAHHSPHLPCAGHTSTPTEIFAFWIQRNAQSSTHFGTFAPLFTDQHAATLYTRLIQHLDTWVHTQTEHPIIPSNTLAHALRVETKAWTQRNLLEPFQHIAKPTRCPRTGDDFTLRACASEHLLHHLTLTTSSPSYTHRIQNDPKPLIRSLMALKHRDDSWVVYEQNNIWTARGRIWKQRVEISIDLASGSVLSLQIDTAQRTNTPSRHTTKLPNP